VNRVRYEIGDFAENPLMPFEARQAGERIRHNGQGKVPAARRSAGMTCVGGAVVANIEALGCERCEARPKERRHVQPRGGRLRRLAKRRAHAVSSVVA
jgi:hypothetical protein